jgi:hypothetical protein
MSISRLMNKQSGMVKSLTCILATLGVILTPILASAIPLTIDFDSLSGMSNSPGLAVPLGGRLSNQLQPTTGAVFSSAAGYVAVVDLFTCCGPNHAISNPNGIGGVNASGQLSYGTPITVTFFDPGSPLVIGVSNFVQIRGDQIPISGTATLEAFDIFGSSLGTNTSNDVVGGLTLTLSVPGIHSVQISQTSATIAVDNLTFESVTPSATPVPEPASLGLVSVGLLGMVGYRLASKWKRHTVASGAGHKLAKTWGTRINQLSRGLLKFDSHGRKSEILEV